MSNQLEALRTFLDGAHSFYHSTAHLTRELDEAGYTRLNESAEWSLVPGGKYYVNRGGSSILAFRVPQSPVGYMMSATHIDHPTFRLKVNGELTGAYTRTTTERYGGLILAPWMDRPLSIAGQAMVETENGIQTRLVDIDRDLALIPNVAIHINRSINENTNLNIAVDMIPLLGRCRRQRQAGKRAGGCRRRQDSRCGLVSVCAPTLQRLGPEQRIYLRPRAG